MATSTPTTTVVVPGTHVMTALVGPRDRYLRHIEQQFPTVQISVRGNEVRISGDLESDVAGVASLFEELSTLLQGGQQLDDVTLDRVVAMVQASERPSEILSHQVLRGAKGRQVKPKTAGQKRYVDTIAENVITFGLGPAGTGKSWLAVAMAVRALQAKEVQRIILTRPAVEAGERLGFLPGDLMAKIDPYLRPLYDALYDMLDPDAVQRLLERQIVEVAPLAFMRGRTLNGSFIILDEAQNATPEQMKMFLTRIGFGSRVVVTGDTTQVDVPTGKSGLVGLERTLTGIDGLGFVRPLRSRRGSSPDRRRHRRRVRTAERAGSHVVTAPPDRTVAVVVADERSAGDSPTAHIDLDRWRQLAEDALAAEAAVGELTLTFIDAIGDGRVERRAHGQGRPDRRVVVPDGRRSDRPGFRPCSATW